MGADLQGGAGLLLHPAYRHATDGHRHLFANGDELTVLEGAAAHRLLPRVLPLLDGTRTAEQVGDVLPAGAREAVHALLRRLGELGLVVEVPAAYQQTDEDMRTAAGFLAATLPLAAMDEVVSKLTSTEVAVYGGGNIARDIRSQLLAPNLRSTGGASDDWSEPSENASLVIVAPSPSELERVGAWNAVALERKIPWLQVLPWEGRYLAVGPLFIPGETCCHECYRIRRSVNLLYSAEGGDEDALLVDQTATVEAPAWISAVAAGLAVDLAYRWLTAAHPYVPAKFHAVGFGRGLTISHHWVLRVPRCPACSPIANRSPLIPWYDDLA